jgi:hypothetical protein
MSQGWFSGLAQWWNALTPQYVTEAPGGVNAKSHSGASSTAISKGSPGASTGTPGKPADSSSAHSAASGPDPNTAPGAAK